MPTAKLSRVSKFGFQVEGDTSGEGGKPAWVNLSKYEKSLSMNGVKPGDTVEYTVEKGYVVSLKKTDGQSSPAGEATFAKSSAPATRGEPDAKDLRISRLSALSTAFGEPYKAFAAAEDMSLEDAERAAFGLAEDMLKYVVSGVLPGEWEAK